MATPTNRTIQIGISVIPGSGTKPLTVTFLASGSNGVPPYLYSWDFGDGSNIVVGDSVTHTFAESGIYTITVTATDAIPVIGTRSTTVQVNEPTAPSTPEETYFLVRSDALVTAMSSAAFTSDYATLTVTGHGSYNLKKYVLVNGRTYKEQLVQTFKTSPETNKVIQLLALKDENNNLIYDWNPVDIAGNVFFDAATGQYDRRDPGTLGFADYLITLITDIYDTYTVIRSAAMDAIPGPIIATFDAQVLSVGTSKTPLVLKKYQYTANWSRYMIEMIDKVLRKDISGGAGTKFEYLIFLKMLYCENFVTYEAGTWTYGVTGLSLYNRTTREIYFAASPGIWGVTTLQNVNPPNITVSVVVTGTGQTATFTVTVTGGTPPYLYTYDFGDQTDPYQSELNTKSHTYLGTGTVVAKITVQDSATPKSYGDQSNIVNIPLINSSND